MILRRNEACRRCPEQARRGGDQPAIGDHHPLRAPDEPVGERGIAIAHLLERRVEGVAGAARQLAEARGFGGRGVRLQQDRGERGRQRQRDDQRDDRRGRDRHRELLIEGARKAGQEQRGDEHRAEHEDDRDERARHLVHRGLRRLQRRQSPFEVALDILDHDDRVVDDDADREHQPEQRQIVEAVAERREHGEGADERYGNGDDRDHRGAPLLQEHQDHNDDEHHCLQQRILHRVDRLLDELGGIIDDAIFEAFGESLRRGLHLGLDRLGGFERVRPRALERREQHRRVARQIGVAVIVRRAELDARDVGDANLPPVGVGADHDIGELLRVGEAALRLDVELIGVAVRIGRLAE